MMLSWRAVSPPFLRGIYFMKFIYVFFSIAFMATVPTLTEASGLKTIRCTLDQPGISTSWQGKLKSEKGKFSSNPADAVITFDQIDLEQNTAQLIGNAGSVPVHVINTPEMLSFLEITPSGNQILTSVFILSPLESGKYPVVTSRHINVLGPIVSQYYGSCTDLSL